MLDYRSQPTDALVAELANDDNAHVRAVVWELGQRGAESIRALANAMQSNNIQRRKNAAIALGRTREMAIVDILREPASSDSESAVRMYAVWALGQLDDARVYPIVRDALSDPDSHVRAAAAEAIGRHGDRGASKHLMRILADPDAHVREAAVLALGQMLDTQSAVVLIPCLHDSDARVRESTGVVLGDLRVADAREELLELLADPEPDVRQAILVALQSLRDPTTISILQQRALHEEGVTSWGLSLKDSIAQTLQIVGRVSP